MNQELEALGRRAVACKGWRWRRGMRVVHKVSGERIEWTLLEVYGDGHVMAARVTANSTSMLEPTWFGERDALPDLSDPATVGAVLGLVREAWQDPATGIYRHARRWCVIMGGRCEEFFADTEAEVLVCALEAAP